MVHAYIELELTPEEKQTFLSLWNLQKKIVKYLLLNPYLNRAAFSKEDRVILTKKKIIEKRTNFTVKITPFGKRIGIAIILDEI